MCQQFPLTHIQHIEIKIVRGNFLCLFLRCLTGLNHVGSNFLTSDNKLEVDKIIVTAHQQHVTHPSTHTVRLAHIHVSRFLYRL